MGQAISRPGRPRSGHFLLTGKEQFKGLLTADSKAFLLFIFFFLFQQETPVKSLSGSGMLSDSGPQPSSAREEAGICSEMSPARSEIKGTHTEVLPS